MNMKLETNKKLDLSDDIEIALLYT